METVAGIDNKIVPPHHVQQELCQTRPLYRQGRKLTAVKVYSINNESQHLIIYKVPKIKLSQELRAQCGKYGDIKKFEVITKYKTDAFTENYHVQFDRIQSARIAKRFLDNSSFYGEVLHVCYAPEYENLSETKQKLLQRQKDVLSRLVPGPTLSEYANIEVDKTQVNRKRKNPAIPITEKRLKTQGNEQIWNEIPNELDPRLENTNQSKVGFKKHFQISSNNHSKGVKYGPYQSTSTVDLEEASDPLIISTLPTVTQDTIRNNTNKRIIFRRKK